MKTDPLSSSLLSASLSLLIACLALAAPIAGCGGPEEGGFFGDRDKDGYPDRQDCDDEDDARHPGADELCDAQDNDCDGVVDEGLSQVQVYQDADDDAFGLGSASTFACGALPGFATSAGDCDDGDDDIFPGAPEACDGVDTDCDGVADEGGAAGASTFYADGDSDGHGDSAATVSACQPPTGYVAAGGDCDDEDPSVAPGAAEACDGVDSDCDGAVDEGAPDAGTYFLDSDGDGYGISGSNVTACAPPEGYAEAAGDCDDGDPGVSPGAGEPCDGRDNDCDGAVDELGPSPWYPDGDGDGYGDGEPTYACGAPAGHSAQGGDCDEGDATTYPGAPETCDAEDDDCDGDVDEDATGGAVWYLDSDDDGHGDGAVSIAACEAPGGYVGAGDDCDDGDPALYPGAEERCDGVDGDCDGAVDEDAVDPAPWYADADGDGYGAGAPTLSCAAPEGQVGEGGDCDDGDAALHPGAEETCGDGIDQDCDGEDLSGGTWAMPISLTWSGGADGVTAPVAISLTEETAVGHILQAPESVRVYLAPTGAPYAQPYAGLPYALEAGDAGITLWVSLAQGEASAQTLWLYYGHGDAPPVSGPDALFVYHDRFDPPLTPYDLRTNWGGDTELRLVSATYVSAPYSARLSMFGTGSCRNDDFWLVAERSVTIPEAGLYALDLHTWNATCGSCNVRGEVSLGGALLYEGSSAAPRAHSYARSLGAGPLTLSLGVTADYMCSGDFFAAYDDVRIRRVHAAPPLAEARWWEAADVCSGASCVQGEDGGPALVYGDLDGDGYGAGEPEAVCHPEGGDVLVGGDCDDLDPDTHPGAPELCDGEDRDCDGIPTGTGGPVPFWYLDADGDGVGVAAVSIQACTPPEGYVGYSGDCDDGDADIFPGAPDGCDEIDNDCDGGIDEDDARWLYPDDDGDGYGDTGAGIWVCGEGSGVTTPGDCDDADTTIHPGAEETCQDGVDQNCDGDDSVDAFVLPIRVMQQQGAEDLGAPVFVDIEEAVVRGHILAHPESLRLYAARQEDPFADPYEGIPFFYEAVEGAVRIAFTPPFEGALSRTFWLYYGDGAAASVSTPEAAFLLFDDFDAGIEGWEVSTNYEGETALSQSEIGSSSAPFSLRASLFAPDGGCKSGTKNVFATQPVAFPADGAYAMAFVASSQSCSGCRNFSKAQISGVSGFWHEVRDFTPKPYRIDFEAAAGSHGVSVGLRAEQVCSGELYASFDDVRIWRVHPEAPFVEARWWEEVDLCAGVGCALDAWGEPLSYLLDGDGDGFGAGDPRVGCGPLSGEVVTGGDCDDADPSTYPGATELCDGGDRDCDGIPADPEGAEDTWYRDGDGDGFGDLGVQRLGCETPAGYVGVAGDCDDGAAAVNPQAFDGCDGVDSDCDGVPDDDATRRVFPDDDGDGYGVSALGEEVCGAAEGATSGGDCDDADPLAYPGAAEDCENGLDDNCDGLVDGCALFPEETDFLDCEIRFQATGEGSYLGLDIDFGGDLDGDGQVDAAMVGYNNEAYVFFGPVWPGIYAQTQAALTLRLDSDDAKMTAVNLSDVSGDGQSDLIVTTANTFVSAEGVEVSGAAYVYFGPLDRPTAPGTILDLALADVRLYGNTEASIGEVRGGGDFNGDGVGDVLITAAYGLGYDVLVVHGPLTPGAHTALDLADLIVVEGGDRHTGGLTTWAGDLDVDGRDDLAVAGEPVYIFYGGRTGMVEGADADVRLHGMGYDQTSTPRTLDSFSSSLAAPGDLNGDGYDDLVVGAWSDDAVGDAAGALHVYYGPLLGDHSLKEDGPADYTYRGRFAADHLGSRLAPAGDLNGDGFQDLLAEADSARPSSQSSARGRVYIIHGRETIPGGSAFAEGQGGIFQYDIESPLFGGHDLSGDGLADISFGSPNGSYGTVVCLGGE